MENALKLNAIYHQTYDGLKTGPRTRLGLPPSVWKHKQSKWDHCLTVRHGQHPDKPPGAWGYPPHAPHFPPQTAALASCLSDKTLSTVQSNWIKSHQQGESSTNSSSLKNKEAELEAALLTLPVPTRGFYRRQGQHTPHAPRAGSFIPSSSCNATVNMNTW